MKINPAVSATGATGTVTTAGLATSGGANSVFVIAVQSRAAGNTPTDSVGNTYTALTSEFTATLGGVNYFLRVWLCTNGTGSSAHTVTATNGGATFITVHFLEIRGVVGLDTSNSWITDAAASYVSNSLAPIGRGVLVIGFNATFSTIAGTTWTHSGDGFSQLVAYTDGTIGPCSELATQIGGFPLSYQTNLSSVNPVSEAALFLFSVVIQSNDSAVASDFSRQPMLRGPM